MRLDRLTPAHVRRAVQLYLDHAWPPGAPGRPKLTVRDLEGAETLRDMQPFFEHPRTAENVACKRFTLRLGNWRYPFMKFVLQEYLVHEEYFFSVDTHDDLKITPDMPDYAGWCRLREFNRELKQRIEQAWGEADLPTNEDLRALMEGIARLERGERHTARLLIVDDERDVARGLGALLEARGYRVQLAFDGRQVLELLEHDPLPDLVLLDFSMPELDGEEVMHAMRATERCRDLPILLATATDIDLTRVRRASGLLRKPYPRELLFKLIEELLAAAPPQAPQAEPGESQLD